MFCAATDYIFGVFVNYDEELLTLMINFAIDDDVMGLAVYKWLVVVEKFSISCSN